MKEMINANEKIRSRKLITIEILFVLIALLFFICIGMLAYTGAVGKKILHNVIFCFCIFFSLIIIILYFLYDKEKQRITKRSILYYKSKFSNGMIESLLLFIALWSSIDITYGDYFLSELDLNVTFSILIGVYSLLFVVYTFILPTLKKQISNYIEDVEHWFKTKCNDKIKDENLIQDLESKQGGIYKLLKRVNRVGVEIAISTIMFFVSMISVFLTGFDTARVFVFMTVFYDFIILGYLAFVIRSIYTFNLKDMENTMNTQRESFVNTVKNVDKEINISIKNKKRKTKKKSDN